MLRSQKKRSCFEEIDGIAFVQNVIVKKQRNSIRQKKDWKQLNVGLDIQYCNESVDKRSKKGKKLLAQSQAC
jgi:hypothetical protein